MIQQRTVGHKACRLNSVDMTYAKMNNGRYKGSLIGGGQHPASGKSIGISHRLLLPPRNPRSSGQVFGGRHIWTVVGAGQVVFRQGGEIETVVVAVQAANRPGSLAEGAAHIEMGAREY